MSDKSIENVIGDVLHGEARRNAMDFVAHLRASGIPLEEAESYWNVALNGKDVCFILVTGSEDTPGPWTIWSDQEPGSWITWSEDGNDSGVQAAVSVDEHTKETAWSYLNYCASCGGDCSPGKRKTVLGKDFDGLCSSALAFTNPDAKGVCCAKKMVDARIRDIREGLFAG